MIDPLIRNLQSDIAVLQTFINRRQEVGFHDMERMLESLTIHVFRALGLGDLKNKNQLRTNFPAIDLADDVRGIAVQVTSNASSTKIHKTIGQFEKINAVGKSLRDQYQRLYIFGFCNCAKRTTTPAYCELISPATIVDKLVDEASEDAIEDVLSAIRRHQSYASLHPWDDVACLEIALNTINRNAIKHQMSCEGNVQRMTKGLNEISELIGKGSINNKEKSKSINEFGDAGIKNYLRNAMDDIGLILAVVNSSTQNGSVNIDQYGMERIDSIKRKIASDASSIAEAFGIPIQIVTVPR